MKSSKQNKTLFDLPGTGAFFPSGSIFAQDDLDIDAVAMSAENSFSEMTASTEIARPDAQLGTLNDNYRKLSVLASGGQGTIFRARDRKFNRIVAVKCIETSADGKRTRDEFLAEAQLMAQLDHPGILPVYDLCTDKDSNINLAMKLVTGKTLQDYLQKLTATLGMLPEHLQRKNEKRSLRKRLRLFLQICEAVSFAHQKGILHRDLKPANIMLGMHREVYVLDWGLAISLDHPTLFAAHPKGTIAYAAPEILAGNSASRSSDLYALGLILFQMVYLKPPFSGEDYEVTQSIKNGAIASHIHRFGIPVSADLSAIIKKATALSPEDRYHGVDSLISDIYRHMGHEEVTARPDNLPRRFRRILDEHRNWLLAGSLVLALFGLLSISIYLTRALYVTSEQQKRDHALFDIHADGISAAMAIDNRLRSFPQLLLALEKEIGFYLDMAPGNQPVEEVCYPYTAGRPGGIQPPKDYSFVSTYRQKVAFSSMVYKTPPGEKIANLSETLRRFAPLQRSFRNLVLDSVDDADFDHSTELQKFRFIREKFKPPIGFVYFSLKNGLHFCYPFHNDYEEKYDPRLRPWYIGTVAMPESETYWSQPYVDNGELNDLVLSCSRKIFDRHGVFVGCIGVDISFQRLIALLKRSSCPPGSHIQSVLLVDTNGHVIVDTSGHYKHSIVRDTTSFPRMEDTELLRQMNKTSQGQSIRVVNGLEILCFYRKLETLPWFYVAQVDYTEMMQTPKKN